jgi:hypothetical protein
MNLNLARAVGSGYCELEGAGFFDDFFSGMNSTFDAVSKGVDVAQKFAPLLALGKPKKAGRPSKKAGINTGGNFLDDLTDVISNVSSTALKLAPLLALGKPKKGKRAGINTGGIDTGGIDTGGKRGVSKWITHVKKFAKDHNMKYNEALKDPKCSKSYKK